MIGCFFFRHVSFCDISQKPPARLPTTPSSLPRKPRNGARWSSCRGRRRTDRRALARASRGTPVERIVRRDRADRGLDAAEIGGARCRCYPPQRPSGVPSHGRQPQGEWRDAQRAGRAGHAAALRAAQRSRSQRRQVRLRARPMRRLHGAGRRHAGALLRDADRHARPDRGHDARRARHDRAIRIRCRRRSWPSRPRSAATASPA